MPVIPPFVLKRLYVKGSLRTEDDYFVDQVGPLAIPIIDVLV